MAAIITEKFRRHNATQFYESFSETSKNAYYLMIGKSTPFTADTSGGTDDSPSTPADDVSGEFYAWDLDNNNNSSLDYIETSKPALVYYQGYATDQNSVKNNAAGTTIPI